MYHEISESMLANLAEWGDRLRVPGKHRPRAKTASAAVAPKNGGRLHPQPWDKVARGIFEKLHAKPSGCWEWSGARYSEGYGTVRIFGNKGVHIAVYVMFNGPLDPELYVCHRCNNPPCANPGHLYAATPSQNIFDAYRDGLCNMKRGSDNPRARLTEQDVLDARRRKVEGVPMRILMQDYGPTISKVIRGESLGHVPMPPELVAKYGAPKPICRSK